MMLDDASRGGAHDCVMACDVTHDPTDGRAFQAAFGGSDPWKRGEGCGDQESDHDVAHMKLLRATGGDKTPQQEESCRPRGEKTPGHPKLYVSRFDFQC
jgi:hypothetical protein